MDLPLSTHIEVRTSEKWRDTTRDPDSCANDASRNERVRVQRFERRCVSHVRVRVIREMLSYLVQRVLENFPSVLDAIAHRDHS